MNFLDIIRFCHYLSNFFLEAFIRRNGHSHHPKKMTIEALDLEIRIGKQISGKFLNSGRTRRLTMCSSEGLEGLCRKKHRFPGESIGGISDYWRRLLHQFS